MPITRLHRNPREGTFYLQTTYIGDERPACQDCPGHLIASTAYPAGAALFYAVEVKYPDGWEQVEDDKDLRRARKEFGRWRKSQWRTRLVAKHPEAENAVEIH